MRVLVTFAVSVVSFHLVERPIRMGTFVRQWRAWVAVPAGVGVVLVAVVAATTGTTAVASTASRPASAPRDRHHDDHHGAGGHRPSAPPVRVLLFGDSVALTLGLGLSDTSEQDKYGYVLADKGILGCGVVDGPEVELMGTRDDTPPACNGSPLAAGRGRRTPSRGRTSGWPPSTRSSRTSSCSWPGAGRWSTASTRAPGPTS